MDSVMEGGGEEKEAVFDDPLGALSAQNPASPAADNSLMPKRRRESRRVVMMTGVSEELAQSAAAEWDSYKASVMQRFASTGTITVSTALGILSREPKGHKKSVTAAHLEELEDPDKDGHEGTKIISQQEYVTRLRELNDEIAHAWLNKERVSALRLTIKVARLLMDTSVPQFYPTLFVLVTDVMDTVGNLVWDRIKKKAEVDDAGNLIALLPANFTADDVRPEAKETCNNWFYKISCVRELLPRIYLEIAILRCVLFLEKDPPLASFQRLTMMMRGLSDPLASAYAHLYLARRGLVLLPADAGYLINGLNVYLFMFRRVLDGDFDKRISASGVDRRLYVTLVEPVFEWILKCIFTNANQDEISYVLETFGEASLLDLRRVASTGAREALAPVSAVVHYMMKQLPAAYVGNEALNISKMIRSSDDMSLSQHRSYKLLGMKLCECSPPREVRLAVLNDVWKVVMNYTNLIEYLAVADVFLDYILQCCSVEGRADSKRLNGSRIVETLYHKVFKFFYLLLEREVELNTLLRDILKHLHKGVVTDPVLASLESIVFKLLTHYMDLTRVLSLAHVVDILDAFYGDTRVSVYKRLITTVSRKNQKIQDPMTRQFVFELGRVLHDSLDSLSSDDDRRQITRAITRFVQLVDFGHDLEQHLDFLVDCRATFSNMDSLRETLVHVSNRLAVSILQTLKDSPNKQTAEFVKACLTFNEITIPSITSIITRLHLFLETAEAALMNGMLSHTDGLIKSALTCLQENLKSGDLRPKDYEEGISSFLQKLMSFLVVVPGHPQLGAFYIVRGILHLLDSHARLAPGQKRIQVLSGIIRMLTAVGQDKLPYHVHSEQVDSNDVLYFEDNLYHKELLELTKAAVDKLVAFADEPGDKVQEGYQYLDACNSLVTAFSVNPDLSGVCSTLLQKASASLSGKHPYLRSTTEYAQSRGYT